MKRQKKYTTRESIVRDIDAAHRKVDRLSKEAMTQSGLSAASRALQTPHGDELADQASEAASKINGRIERIKTTRLEKLKRTLAAFDSEPFPFTDRQVVLQKQ